MDAASGIHYCGGEAAFSFSLFFSMMRIFRLAMAS
jgi:hypothetical protein